MNDNLKYNNYIYKNYKIDKDNYINIYGKKNNDLYSLLDLFSAQQLRDIRDYLSGSSSSIDFSKYSSSSLIALKLLLSQYGISTSTQTTTLPINSNNNVIVKSEKDLEEKESGKESVENALLNRFFNDITDKKGSATFRGWVLPNGTLLSQYNEGKNGDGLRQDHSRLVKVFMKGLEKFNQETFNIMDDLYNEYKSQFNISDAFESFAVERLGWVQISVCGQKRLAYRAERWQDRLVRDFLVDFNFDSDTACNGRCYTTEFADAYAHVENIIKLGLEERVMLNLK